MRIFINLLFLRPGRVGGTETFTVNLVKNLLEVDTKNEYLLILSRNNKKNFDFAFQKSKFLECDFDNNSRLKRVSFEQFTLPKKLKEQKADLLIAPANTGLINSPCKQLLIIHDLIYFVYPEYFSWVKRTYLKNLVKYSCKKAIRIVTVSQNTKDDIIKYVGEKEEKIDIIYEGVDFEKFSKTAREEGQNFVQKQYGIQKYIYSPTSLYPHKNNDSLIKAFAKLKTTKKIPQKLIITGNDPYKKIDWLKNVILECKMENEVFYLGRVPSEHLPYLYSGADLTTYLSSYEGFGLPVLEAMAASCPVLSSNRSSLPEIVGDAAILVNPFEIDEIANKMNELLTDEKLRKECITKGLERAKEFSWENVAKRLIQTYNKL